MTIDPVDFDMTIRELPSLVRQILLLKHPKAVTVLDSHCNPVTVPGGCYGSTVSQLYIVIEQQLDYQQRQQQQQQGQNNGPQRLVLKYLVKQLPPTRIQRLTFKHPLSFNKELYYYETLAPLYRYYSGIDFSPDYVCSRKSLKLNAGGHPDNDALIVTEYMDDFKVGDRYRGMSVEEASIVVQLMAWFHATGIVIKRKDPSIFKNIRTKYGLAIHKEKSDRARLENIGGMIDQACRYDPELWRLRDDLKATQKSPRLDCCYPAVMQTYKSVKDDPLSCLCHNDLWPNNIMIRKRPEVMSIDANDKHGRASVATKEDRNKNAFANVRFVDFQTYYVNSPLTELCFFIFVSLKLPFGNAVEQLVGQYRETLVTALVDFYDFGDVRSQLAPEAFFKRLKRDARDELYHIVKFARICELEVDGDPFDPMETSTITRLQTIFRFYEAKGWLEA